MDNAEQNIATVGHDQIGQHGRQTEPGGSQVIQNGHHGIDPLSRDTTVTGDNQHNTDIVPHGSRATKNHDQAKKTVIVSISSKVRGSGGLYTAISSVDNVVHCGLVVEDDEYRRNSDTINAAYEKSGCIAIPVDEKVHDENLNGFSNSVMWALFHYQPVDFDILEKIPHLYKAYEDVNVRVATALFDHFSKQENSDVEPIFWIHDYHFMVLPFYLKQLLPNAKIGWYLHPPFPVYDAYRTLYKGKEMLEKLFYADLIAFNTHEYARHFIDTVHQLFLVDDDSPSDNGVSKRKVKEILDNKIAVCTIGIDSNMFKVRRNIQARDTKRPVFRFLGVERRDVVKGIPHKLTIFRKFLEQNPTLRQQTELYQILVPTRHKIPAVNKMFEQSLALVGEINKEYGTANHTPVTLINEYIPFEDLLDLFQTSDAMLITALIDGLNLVAFEYLASQDVENPGVLMLSKYAGCYEMLKDGVLEMDPYDMEFSVSQLTRAVTMGKAEKLKLFNKVESFGNGNNSKAWAEQFIGKLKAI